MSQEETDLTELIKTNHIMNRAYNCAQAQDMSEVEMLRRLVKYLLELNDDVFQQRLDELRFNPQPLVTRFR